MKLTSSHIIAESSRGYDLIPVADELLRQSKIFLTEEINTETATDVIMKLMALSGTDAQDPIFLYISSPGGSIDAGMAIVDAIKSIDREVHTFCMGLSASMAAVIFSCGSRRFMYPASRLMIHDPLIEQTGGNALQLKAVSDSLLEHRDKIGRLLARNTGKTLEEILELTSKDTYFNAEEAVKFGLADQIYTKEINKNED